MTVSLTWSSGKGVAFDTATAPIETLELSLSKTPVIIPIPNNYNIGFDIGFVESESITMTGKFLDGMTATIEGATTNGIRLFSAMKFKTGIEDVDKYKPWSFISPIYTGEVFLTGLTLNSEGGGGDIVSYRITLTPAVDTL